MLELVAVRKHRITSLHALVLVGTIIDWISFVEV